MVCMLLMVSIILLSAEYLHSMSCKHLLPLYVMSFTSRPYEFFLYPMAQIMFGLRCFGLLCFRSRVRGNIVGSCGVVLSSCSPFWPGSKACR